MGEPAGDTVEIPSRKLGFYVTSAPNDIVNLPISAGYGEAHNSFVLWAIGGALISLLSAFMVSFAVARTIVEGFEWGVDYVLFPLFAALICAIAVFVSWVVVFIVATTTEAPDGHFLYIDSAGFRDKRLSPHFIEWADVVSARFMPGMNEKHGWASVHLKLRRPMPDPTMSLRLSPRRYFKGPREVWIMVGTLDRSGYVVGHALVALAKRNGATELP
ncbi:MAG: hypothetical protein LCH88_21620 [Proteobacteria bacterium]|nr:hypothetical protein [Pseudomonadota bacterium]